MDQDTARAISTILTALGGGTILISIGRTLWKRWTGRAGRERARNNDLVAKRREAEERADDEAAKRRAVQEYASKLRRQLIVNGLEPPDEPVLEQTLTKSQLKELRETEK